MIYFSNGVGPGQPRKYKNPKRVSAVLDSDNVEKLEEIRWREHKSFNEMLNKAIEEYVRNHYEGNDTFKLDKWQEDPNFKAIPTLLASKEKWIECIDCCSDSELTNIGIMSNTIHNLVKMRRTKEYKEKIRIETKRI